MFKIEYKKEKFIYRLLFLGGIVVFGIGVVFLFSSVFSILVDGRANILSIILGLLLVFVGNTSKLVGRKKLDSLLGNEKIFKDY